MTCCSACPVRYIGWVYFPLHTTTQGVTGATAAGGVPAGAKAEDFVNNVSELVSYPNFCLVWVRPQHSLQLHDHSMILLLDLDCTIYMNYSIDHVSMYNGCICTTTCHIHWNMLEPKLKSCPFQQTLSQHAWLESGYDTKCDWGFKSITVINCS